MIRNKCVRIATCGTILLVCQSAMALSGGNEDTGSSPLFPAVGFVRNEDRACTGILVTPAHVIVANHCITGALDWADHYAAPRTPTGAAEFPPNRVSVRVLWRPPLSRPNHSQ